ncbi:MAG: hypothetical protein M3362_23915 [Acidobacteriota bacterium]|nr:hypothetical protein [Acidobacteriota bacterium]
MSIPEESLDLTSEEQEEYERQTRQLSDPHWHDWGKCGEQLELRFVSGKKRHTRFHRLYCVVHKVLVDMSGYEIGYSLGSDSRYMNEVKWIQKKHRFNQ